MMRETWRLLVCSECGEMDDDQTVCGFCESEEGVTMVDVVPADTHQKARDDLGAIGHAFLAYEHAPPADQGEYRAELLAKVREIAKRRWPASEPEAEAGADYTPHHHLP
jgi:hypothetical protein